jgi:hypothetical protein
MAVSVLTPWGEGTPEGGFRSSGVTRWRIIRRWVLSMPGWPAASQARSPGSDVARFERRPSSGSCATCRAALDLVSIKVGGIWYCGTACAEGQPTGKERRPGVPEAWLYPVLRRFYRKRRPIELRAKKPSS